MQSNKRHGPWKRIVLIAVVTVICILTFAWDFNIKAWYKELKDQLHCYELTGNKLLELSDYEPKLGFSIFFHETSCPKQMLDVTLGARQSCSIESALLSHPNTDVFLLISSPVLKPLQETENIFIEQLLSYQNFKPRHITFSKYLSDTPLRTLYETGALYYSSWPVQHASDVLRYATLYKYGGIYLDLDVIVLKPLTNLKNFVGAESDVSLGSGILGFSFDEVGRQVATECVKELASTYNGKVWGFNGPGLITRVMEKKCQTTAISSMLKSSCGGFKVYPTDFFQAIPYNEAGLIFQEGNMKKVRKMLNQSYTVHCWNKMSAGYVLNNTQEIPYLFYARQYCPKTYKAAGGNFN